jgi:predicted GIY-YIG superfamily endonuclease
LIEEFQFIDDAIFCERRRHGWSRAMKFALIAGDYDRIRRLASRAERRLRDAP